MFMSILLSGSMNQLADPKAVLLAITGLATLNGVLCGLDVYAVLIQRIDGSPIRTLMQCPEPSGSFLHRSADQREAIDAYGNGGARGKDQPGRNRQILHARTYHESPCGCGWRDAKA